MSKLLTYFVTTPYIDAYEHDWGPEHPKVDFPGFVKKMTRQAYGWGEQGIGRALVKGNSAPEYDGRLVLAIGIFGDEDKYVAVQRDRGTATVEVVAADWPVEWDVT